MRRFLDALLGRARPVRSQLDQLFAITTANLTLTVDLDLKPAGRAGICFRPVGSSRFAALAAELRELLQISGRESGTLASLTTDNYGFQWVVLADDDFEDLVATVHLVSLTLRDGGFGEQLLAAVFRFERAASQTAPAQVVHWVYNYKRGSFYPFVPSGERQRDHAAELRLAAVLERELPMEKDLERWYPLWGIPV